MAGGSRGSGSSGRGSDSSSSAPAPAPAHAPTVAVLPVFALTPAQANPNTFIDYTTSTGIKLFQSATETLSIKFDGNADTVDLFCEQLN